MVAEALLVSALAFPLALLLARAAGTAVELLSPLYLVLPWDPSVLARGAAAAGLAGSLVPLRRLAALEPDLVFRS